MCAKTLVTFRVRDKGGPSGGKTISQTVPNFEFVEFMRTPNAEEFVKKAYFASVKKIMREVDEQKNGSTQADLNSTEAIVARSLTFTTDEIREWVNTRDWTRAAQVKNIEKIKPIMIQELPKISSRKNPFTKEIAERLAYVVVAAVADDHDPVADFIFTILTSPHRDIDDCLFGLE